MRHGAPRSSCLRLPAFVYRSYEASLARLARCLLARAGASGAVQCFSCKLRGKNPSSLRVPVNLIQLDMLGKFVMAPHSFLFSQVTPSWRLSHGRIIGWCPHARPAFPSQLQSVS